MAAPNPKVWVVNQGGHVYDDAKRFGELKPVTQGRINVFSIDNLVHAVKQKLYPRKKKMFQKQPKKVFTTM